MFIHLSPLRERDARYCLLVTDTLFIRRLLHDGVVVSWGFEGEVGR